MGYETAFGLFAHVDDHDDYGESELDNAHENTVNYEGYTAYNDGKGLDANPYRNGTLNSDYWAQGWHDARKDDEAAEDTYYATDDDTWDGYE